MTDALSVDARFVGRDDELARLIHGLRSASAAGVGVAVVQGEAGIGKTRLLSETAGRLGWKTAWSRCWDGEGTPALWPWVQLLRVLGQSSGADPSSALGSLLAGEHVGGGDGAARFALFEAIVDRLAELCSAEPLTVVIDDLQWADAGSLRLLRFVAGDRRLSRLVVLTALRDDAPASRLLDEVIVEAARTGLHVRLVGLPVSDVEVLVRQLRGAATQREVERLHRRSGGNPLFVAEFLRIPTADAVPAGVATVVRMRVEAVSPETHAVLEAAAVLGSEFDVADVAQLRGLEPTSVTAALDEALEARLIRVGSAPRRFEFVHAVVQEVLYDGLSLAERHRLHLLAGRALQARGLSAVTEVAHHLLHGPAERHEEASAWAAKAAAHCFGVGAYEQAASWYGRALAASGGSGGPDEAELLIHRGEACLAAGDVGEAGDLFREAAAVARHAGDGERLACAALGLGSGRGGFEVPLQDPSQIALLEEALVALGPGASVTRAAVLARLSIALGGASVETRRRGLAAEAIAVARAVGNDAAIGHALAAHCDVIAGPDHSEVRATQASSIVELAQRSGDRQLALLGHRLRFIARLEMGDVPGADEDAGRFEAIADQLRQPSSQWYVPLWRGMRALMLGDPAAAVACTVTAEEIGARAGSFNAFVLCFTQRWVAMRSGGRFEEAGAALRDAARLGAGETPLVSGIDQVRLRALVAIQLGDAAQASALLDELLRSGMADRHHDSEWLPEMVQLAEIAATVGHRSAGTMLLEALLPYRERYCVEGIGAAFTGSVSWYLAMLARSLGHSRDAETFERAAAVAHLRVGMVGVPPALSGDVPPSAESSRSVSVEAASLLNEGATWAVTFAAETRRLRDSKGIRDLAILLARPGVEVHCLELAGGVDVGDSVGPAIDDRARSSYQQRIRDLQEDIDDARNANDVGRAERAEIELDALVEQLSAAFGLSGRQRKMGAAAERARTTVTSRIRSAIRHAADLHPDLGRHLDRSIRTGTWCAYLPENPVAWHVAASPLSQ